MTKGCKQQREVNSLTLIYESLFVHKFWRSFVFTSKNYPTTRI